MDFNALEDHDGLRFTWNEWLVGVEAYAGAARFERRSRQNGFERRGERERRPFLRLAVNAAV